VGSKLLRNVGASLLSRLQSLSTSDHNENFVWITWTIDLQIFGFLGAGI
jgi:hypothetical protein